MKPNYHLISFKKKKDLISEIDYYKSIILKKVENGDYSSALEKVQSTVTLLEEHQEYFNIEKELHNFYELNQTVRNEFLNQRRIYQRRFNNLLREKLTESNLENFSKILAMLKHEVDCNLKKLNLENISTDITKYFKFIKKLYEILSCYRVLDYHYASNKIFEFVKDVKQENFPNLKLLISSVYQDLLSYRISELSKEFDKISIPTLSKKLAIDKDRLIEFVNLIQKKPKSPIKGYTLHTQEIYFKRPPT